MLNNESNVTATETLPESAQPDLQKSDNSLNDAAQSQAVGNEQIQTPQDVNSVSEETKTQWRKREKALSSEKSRLENENSQYRTLIHQFIQNGQVPPSQQQAAQQPQVNEVEKQMQQVFAKMQTQRLQQEQQSALADFGSRFENEKYNDERLPELVQRVGPHVSETMIHTLSLLSPDYESEKLLSHMLINEPAELKRISSLSPVEQTRELTERAFKFRESKQARKSNAPAPASMTGIKTNTSTQVDINMRSLEEHKAMIRERDKKRYDKWRTRF